MNIIPLHQPNTTSSNETGDLFARMETSLKMAHADLEKSIRIAKTLAPILCDQSSNERHIKTITSDAPVQEKVIAILMLGFPKNRPLLPVIAGALKTGSDAIRMASAIAISQMRNGHNNHVLAEVLSEALNDESSLEVKKTLRKTISLLMAPKSLSDKSLPSSFGPIFSPKSDDNDLSDSP